MIVRFIDDQRGEHGVEPICKVLPIAPSTYYDHLAKRADPARLSDRARRDTALRPEIERVFEENWRVYGVRKVWRQMEREGFDVARCTVARLMKGMGIQGIIRGKPHKTTVSDKKALCPLDKVTRAHTADPHLVRKIVEGPEDDIRPCLGANYCLEPQPLCAWEQR